MNFYDSVWEESHLQNRLGVLLNLQSAHIANKEMLCIVNKPSVLLNVSRLKRRKYVLLHVFALRQQCLNFLLLFLLADELLITSLMEPSRIRRLHLIKNRLKDAQTVLPDGTSRFVRLFNATSVHYHRQRALVEITTPVSRKRSVGGSRTLLLHRHELHTR